MLRTYAEMETFIQSELNDTSSGVQTQLRTLLELGTNKLRAALKADLVLQNQTITSAADTSAYDLHPRFRSLRSLVITVGGVRYVPDEIPNRAQWDSLTGGTASSITSNIPQAFSIFDGQLHIYPTPADTSQSIVLEYFGIPKDLTANDFTDKTAGTITLTNGAATLAGSGTSFDAQDVNRYVKIDNEGDWYPISAYSNSTTMTLGQNYLGTTASGASYTIGTIPPFVARYPEAAELLVYFALGGIWRKREGFSAQGGMATKFESLYKEGLKELRKQVNIKYNDPVVKYVSTGSNNLNPNNYPTNLS